jgi:hypothetical protein
MIGMRHLFIPVEFPPGGRVLALALKRKKNEYTYIRRNNTDNRTHKMVIKTYKTIQQK